MKKKIFATAIAAICLSLSAFGTLAYFTAEDTAHNVITSGNIKIDLLEWADKDKTVPFPEKGLSGAMPGSKITKIVEVKNTGSNDAYVRVRVKKDIILAGKTDKKPDTDLMILDFNKTSWTLEKDGFYYYKKALKPGEMTEPLFASVKFDTKMDNLYKNSTATVDVFAYAVQSANNGDTVFNAAGWPEA